MKQIVSLFLICLFSCFAFNVKSQCSSGDLYFVNQVQIDTFNRLACGGQLVGTNIAGSISIQGGVITNLDGLSGLTSVGGNLFILQTQLTSVSGLSGLTSVGLDFVFQNNTALTTISGFGALTNVRNLSIDGNLVLTTVSGFNALTSIDGGNGNFNIYDNPALTTLTGFNTLTTVRDIYFANNNALTTISGFGALTTVSNAFNIYNNAALTTISGFGALTNVGSFSIGENPALTTLTGFNTLTTVGGNFYINHNLALKTITGFGALTTINGYLFINNNNALTSLDGLKNIPPNSISDLAIVNNAQLSACAIKSTCGYLQIAPAKSNTIYGNLSGCNSKTEVLAACTLAGLPIDLISFTGTHIGSFNELNWRTATETNNNHFDIERSNGASVFEKLGEVQGAGNSQSILAYSFRDEMPMQGGNYYRLKQIDNDGKFTYSNIIEVENPKAVSFSLSPNPSSDKIYVYGVSDNTSFSITNIQGQILQSGILLHHEAINISTLEQGMYFLRTSSHTAKFVKENAN